MWTSHNGWRSCARAALLKPTLKTNVGEVTGWQVAEFLILHGEFPRSIRFCSNQLSDSLTAFRAAKQDTSATKPSDCAECFVRT